MNIVKLTYYRNNEEIDCVRVYSLDDEISVELMKFINTGECNSIFLNDLIELANINSCDVSMKHSRQDICFYYIEKHGKELCLDEASFYSININ